MHPPKKKEKKKWKNLKNGVLGRFWADLDCRFEFYVKNYVGWWVQICFLSIFENLVIRQFGYPAFYQAISIKSTFEPITTPLKWLLADAACKVSMIFFNIAPVWAGNCKMDCQNTEFYSRVLLFTTSSFFLYTFAGGASRPPRGGRTKKKN